MFGFDVIEYLKTMAGDNKLAIANDFFVAECSGLEAIEPIIEQYQDKANFILIDNTVDGSMSMQGASALDNRIYTISIISRYEWGNMVDREVKKGICQTIFRQMISRLKMSRGQLVENDATAFLSSANVRYREMDNYSMSGATGVTFMLTLHEPVSIKYNDDEWQ